LSKRFPILPVILAATVAVALLLAGCGGKAGDPMDDLSAAARHAGEAGSVHAQANIILEPLEGEQGIGLNVQGDVWLDMNKEALEARFTVMGMELALRYVDGTAYTEWGGEWYYLTDEGAAGLGVGSVKALVRLLFNYPDILSNVSGVEELGDKKIGDYDCRELKVTLDIEAVTAMQSVQELAAGMDITPEEIDDYLKESGLEVTVWASPSCPPGLT